MENFVYTTNKSGQIQSGGYAINSNLMLNTLNTSISDLAVPAGLFFSKKVLENNKNGLTDNLGVIDEDIYTKLLKLASPDLKTKKKKTRAIKKKSKNNTRRSKK